MHASVASRQALTAHLTATVGQFEQGSGRRLGTLAEGNFRAQAVCRSARKICKVCADADCQAAGAGGQRRSGGCFQGTRTETQNEARSNHVPNETPSTKIERQSGGFAGRGRAVSCSTHASTASHGFVCKVLNAICVEWLSLF